MTNIGLIADTHGYLDPAVFSYFKDCDEVWHAGDFGSTELIKELQAFKPLKGVYGNIDGHEIRAEFPEVIRWRCEDVTILMMHIGGYPGRYSPSAKTLLKDYPPQLFISGHSHILKVIYDDKLKCLHMNPGAAGKHGWHKVRTIIRFSIDGTRIFNCEVIELGKRSLIDQ